MRREEELIAGLRYVSGEGGFRYGTDTVLLSAFAPAPSPGEKGGGRVCELCCGAGALALMFLARNPGSTLDGLELDGEAAGLAEENVRLNRLEGRLRIFRGDLRREPELLERESYSLVICNPPYFQPGRGCPPRGEKRALAREENACTVYDAAAAASRLLRFGGRFAAVFRPERICDLLEACRRAGLEPKKLRYAAGRPGLKPSILLVEAKKGGAPGLETLPTLYIRDENGRETDEARDIYLRERIN